MKWPFGRKQVPVPVAPVTSIIIPQSSFDNADTHSVPMAVVDFVNFMMREAMYRRNEIPNEALLSYHVDYYLAQVNNGGHGQFAGNSGWQEATIVDIQYGLLAMGLDEALEVFEGLMLFAHEDPDRFVAAAEAGGFGDIDPIIKDLDDRFFAGPSKQILAGNDHWLRTEAPLEIVPDTEHRARMAALADANPLRGQRSKS